MYNKWVFDTRTDKNILRYEDIADASSSSSCTTSHIVVVLTEE